VGPVSGPGTLTRPPRSGGPTSPQPEDGMDPRIARRRADVAAEASDRRRRRLIRLVVALTVVGGVLALLWSPLLAVDRLVLDGPALLADDVGAGSGVERGDPMVSVDRAEVRRRVLGVPGVASARVEVRWPGTVRIAYVAERPLARVVAPERVPLVVATDGRVLGVPGSPAAGTGLGSLAEIAVEDSEQLPTGGDAAGREVGPALSAWVDLLGDAAPELAPVLSRSRLAADGSVTLELSDGGAVLLGVPTDGPAKLLAVATVLGGRVERRCLDVLDVRVPNRPTVSRTPGCDLPPVATTTVPRDRSSTRPGRTASTTTTTTSTPRSASGSTTRSGR
jgi:cell division protein FtsQ